MRPQIKRAQEGHLCIKGTFLDSEPGTKVCRLPALRGSDYCEGHLSDALACVVRCCVDKPRSTGRKRLCEKHALEFEAGRGRVLSRWLASRINDQALAISRLRQKELSSAPGFVSLEAIGVVLGFVALAAFVVSGFAILAGGVLKDDVVVVLGALGFIGCLAFFGFLVMQGHKERGPRE